MKLVSLITIAWFFAASAGANEIPARLAGKDVVTGKPVEMMLKDSDKTVVVAFLSAKCPCSSSHEQSLKDLQAQFSPKGIIFVGVHSNADETSEIAREHFRSSALPFPMIGDKDSETANALGALKTPHVYVIRRGEILFQGGIDDSQIATNAKKFYLKDALTAISEGKKPEVVKVRAIGCIIKRS